MRVRRSTNEESNQLVLIFIRESSNYTVTDKMTLRELRASTKNLEDEENEIKIKIKSINLKRAKKVLEFHV